MTAHTVTNQTSSAQAVRVLGGKKGEVKYDTLMPGETKENVQLDMESRSTKAKIGAGVLKVEGGKKEKSAD